MEEKKMEKLIQENKKLRMINRLLAVYVVISVVIMLYNLIM
jgi:hypothetical protein